MVGRCLTIYGAYSLSIATSTERQNYGKEIWQVGWSRRIFLSLATVYEYVIAIARGKINRRRARHTRESTVLIYNDVRICC